MVIMLHTFYLDLRSAPQGVLGAAFDVSQLDCLNQTSLDTWRCKQNTIPFVNRHCLGQPHFHYLTK